MKCRTPAVVEDFFFFPLKQNRFSNLNNLSVSISLALHGTILAFILVVLWSWSVVARPSIEYIQSE